VNLQTGAAIFKIKVAEGMQYRIATLSNAAVGIFWGIIEVTVYRIFFIFAGNQTVINTAAFTLPQLISYLWLIQILLALSPHNIEGDLLAKIDGGDIGIELCRPLDLYAHWFARTAASKISPLLLRGAPVLVFALLMPAGWRLGPPDSVAGFLLMLVSCALSLLLGTAYTMLVTSVRMNVTWGNGPMHIILLLGMVFSGAYLPLQLWPDSLQRLLLFQPFAGYMDIPLRLYIGTMRPNEAALGFGLQIFWIFAFVLIGRAIMKKRLRKTIVQGG